MLSKPAVPSATRTSAKRKTRPDDTEDELQQTDSEQPKTMNRVPRLRARAKKAAAATEDEPEQPIAASEPATVAKTSRATAATAASTAAAKPAVRTRTRKVVAASGAQQPEPPVAAAEPAPKTTRTRVRKTPAVDDQSDSEPLAAPGHTPKKATGTRKRVTSSTKESDTGTITTLVPTTNPTPGLKSNFVRPASRLSGTTKKSVSFEEPEKENMVPVTQAKVTKAKTPAELKTTTATGMRARPVRKITTAAARTTRTSARMTGPVEKKPLSPKKDGANRPMSRCDESSDDELATHEKTPMKPLMKSPVKPPVSLLRPEHKPQQDEDGSIMAPDASTMAASVMRSPARRPPASPFKDAMMSPAKKIEPAAFGLSDPSVTADGPQSPSKASLLQSPAKRPQVPIKAFQMSSNEDSLAPRSPVKRSLFGSPAKRGAGTPFKSLSHESLATKKEQTLATDPEQEEAPLSEQVLEEITVLQEEDEAEDEADSSSLDNVALNQQIELELSTQLTFPGRLSAVLPRHADPALKEKQVSIQSEEPAAAELDDTTVAPTIEQEPVAEEVAEDHMEVDAMVTDETITTGQGSRARSLSPMKAMMNPMFRLRAKDLDDDYMSESEDELASSGKTESKFQDTTTISLDNVPATPTPSSTRTPRNGLPSSAVKAASRAIRSVSKGNKHGFTPLAAQFGDWRASSPSKLKQQQATPASPATTDEDLSLVSEDSPRAQSTPGNAHFFDDEMKIRADMEMEAMIEADLAAGYGDDSMLGDMMDITTEDVELAAEANEMSLMDEADARTQTFNMSHDDTASDASQEYGDENAIPVDPALTSNGKIHAAPSTPARPVMRSFHTTSKVPLKPADDTPPARSQARSFSASKAASKRPVMPTRNATVISYSPTKERGPEQDNLVQPTTPGKAEACSTAATPARTPRRDLNTELLRGAVVFVDVHTSEGSDASAVFVDLLNHMGARCVKTWNWNPSHDGNGESKIGITHVVYKDGGKRTMERVRQSNGVVQCVGVGWVLDCERKNEWVDESTHYIDTSLIPRGGRNRRKSMEPKALANVNGALVTPMKNNAGAPRECMTAPGNQMNRRDSSLWMRSPSDMDEDEDAPGEADDWHPDVSSVLTPVPKTPAPEAVARYAMNLSPESSSADEDSILSQEPLGMQTCPPKKSTMFELGENVLSHRKNESVMMRLMAARRKSLQFAPKVASPLSKAWY